MRPYKEICEDRDPYWNQYQCAPAPFARYCPIIHSPCAGDKRKVVARPARVITYSHKECTALAPAPVISEPFS